MSAPRLSHRMSAEDAWFLYFEKPDAPLHIGSVGIFEGTIPFDKAYESLNARMHLIPRYRQRAIIPPFYAGHPTWEDDPEFSLERHLTLIELPAPGSEAQLIETASKLFEDMLPRDRPLWHITMVHGLEGGRSALVSRVHHCLVDGVSGIELLMAVLDLVPDPEPTAPPAEPWQPKAPPSPLQSWGDAVFEQWQSGLRAMTEIQESILDPRGQFRAATEFARALEIAVPSALRRPTAMPWNKAVSRDRLVAWTEMKFQEVRGIRSRLGGTVNDVVLAILTGGIARYLESKGVTTDGTSLRLMIPVNVRSESEQGALGNRVSMMLPEIPLGIANPAERLMAVRTEMERLKSHNQANAFESLARWSQNLPAAVHAIAGMGGVPQGTFNVICTNVPGPLIPLYSVGHRMLAHYPLVPLAGDLGIGVGITSFDKGLYMGIMSDPNAMDDVDVLRRFVDEEFRLLRTLAAVPESDLPDFHLPPQQRNGHARDADAPARAPEEQPAATT